MLRLTENTRVYVAARAVDFRKAINGLAALVIEQFEIAPNDGSVYVFYNRGTDRVKCLFWDKNGFVLYYKRLEKSRFQYSKSLQGDTVVVNPAQLKALLMGLDFYLLGQYPSENYSEFF